MKLLTKQHLIDGICDRWLAQYYYLGAWKYGTDKEKIYHNLVKLGDNKTEENIAKVIGNGSWTHLTCDECSSEVDEVIIFLEEWDNPVQLCKSCINKAISMFNKQGEVTCVVKVERFEELLKIEEQSKCHHTFVGKSENQYCNKCGKK